MELTVAHWMYALITVTVIVTMVFRKGVVLPALIGTLLVSWVYTGSLVGGFTSIFNANLVAAKALFSIFLIITFMVALLHSLKDLGADKKMIKPIQKIMVNGHLSFFILIGVTYVISLFFWPTPAVPLICALLVPAAVRAGLPAMRAAMAVALAGQGMALSSDYVMQVAPGLSATAAGVTTSLIADKALALSLSTGVIAIGITYVLLRKEVRKPESDDALKEFNNLQGLSDDLPAVPETAATSEGVQKEYDNKWGNVFAVLVPLSMLGIAIYMVFTKVSGVGGLEGGGGAALIGGVAVLLLALASVAYGRTESLDNISNHIIEGFVFAFRAMGPVIPIAGFFFLGSGDFSAQILSLGEDAAKPAFLFDLVQAGQNFIPQSDIFTAFGILIIGIITGLDGSGFSGLPVTGALSGALASGSADASTFAAIGQVGTIWTGGGTLVAWSSLVAVAGFCGVSVLELVRKNFIPVSVGLVASTILALIIW
jgi:hypothetical protein